MAAVAKTKVTLGKTLKANTGRVTRLTGIPKLEDANDAGGRNSAECTLILTEGDSAKALAVAGLSVIGRDKYGVFPLRGKVLNVRDATLKQMMANAEIQNLVKIIGLDMNKEYDAELKGLRYGSIMIMADQDFDGSHIKGLLINLIHAWWPTLAKLPGFVKEFFTPIVKVSRGKSVQSFFTIPEYEAWKKAHDNGKGFRIKYYKGLGTSTAKEAKEYFGQLEKHRLGYRYDGPQDDMAIDMAFNKKRADDRKAWISNYEEGSLVDHTQSTVSYKDFIDKELVLFSQANVVRAIPSVVDGFKPSQRKVLFGCFKRKLKNDVKVAQLVGYVSEHAAYHHGESSLSETIVGMAQDFTGSNNLNLLVPQGQFGTRLQGGKDSASARYIYTRLSPVTRAIFHEADDHILDYLNEEGQSIEPRWYCPIIPMVLVNGVDGIGTGWSSSLPNFNPRDIIENIRRWIKNQELKDMLPWYQGFTGTISKSREEGKVEVTGCATYNGNNRATITELPVKKWTQDYREFLEENLPKGTKKEGVKLLQDYQEYHTENSVHFELELSEDGNSAASQGAVAIQKAFKLRTSLSLHNMMLFDQDGKIKKYETAVDILVDFCKVRLNMYEKRRAYLLNRLERECEVLSAKARFVQLVINGKLQIRRRKITDLAQDLRKNNFKALSELKGDGPSAGAGEEKDDAEEDEDEEAEEEEEAGEQAEEGGSAPSAKSATAKAVKDFEYLVGMPISTLTAEKVAELMKQHDLKMAELDTLKKKKPADLWLNDLNVLENLMDERDASKQAEEEKEKARIQKARAAKEKDSSKGAGKGKRGLKRSASGPPERTTSATTATAGSRKRGASEERGGRAKKKQ
eukprot:TRINITY_DN26703_c0_g1_i1.p1 TRINITY_DN26703_c0_g1~~TRINITY_DN26703_c0_g1_i1.p1  ORF type:complete len:977 (-),score=291.70 TRINITY_DN26703_c0_g1_i1:158-2722(-)